MSPVTTSPDHGVADEDGVVVLAIGGVVLDGASVASALASLVGRIALLRSATSVAVAVVLTAVLAAVLADAPALVVGRVPFLALLLALALFPVGLLARFNVVSGRRNRHQGR